MKTSPSGHSVPDVLLSSRTGVRDGDQGAGWLSIGFEAVWPSEDGRRRLPEYIEVDLDFWMASDDGRGTWGTLPLGRAVSDGSVGSWTLLKILPDTQALQKLHGLLSVAQYQARLTVRMHFKVARSPENLQVLHGSLPQLLEKHANLLRDFKIGVAVAPRLTAVAPDRVTPRVDLPDIAAAMEPLPLAAPLVTGPSPVPVEPPPPARAVRPARPIALREVDRVLAPVVATREEQPREDEPRLRHHVHRRRIESVLDRHPTAVHAAPASPRATEPVTEVPPALVPTATMVAEADLRPATVPTPAPLAVDLDRFGRHAVYVLDPELLAGMPPTRRSPIVVQAREEESALVVTQERVAVELNAHFDPISYSVVYDLPSAQQPQPLALLRTQIEVHGHGGASLVDLYQDPLDSQVYYYTPDAYRLECDAKAPHDPLMVLAYKDFVEVESDSGLTHRYAAELALSIRPQLSLATLHAARKELTVGSVKPVLRPMTLHDLQLSLADVIGSSPEVLEVEFAADLSAQAVLELTTEQIHEFRNSLQLDRELFKGSVQGKLVKDGDSISIPLELRAGLAVGRKLRAQAAKPDTSGLVSRSQNTFVTSILNPTSVTLLAEDIDIWHPSLEVNVEPIQSPVELGPTNSHPVMLTVASPPDSHNIYGLQVHATLSVVDLNADVLWPRIIENAGSASVLREVRIEVEDPDLYFGRSDNPTVGPLTMLRVEVFREGEVHLTADAPSITMSVRDPAAVGERPVLLVRVVNVHSTVDGEASSWVEHPVDSVLYVQPGRTV